MHIQELILEYFEIHIHTHFLFHEGVNYIIGDNDQGKSSVKKALKWVVDNKLSGQGFRNRKHPNKDTVVTIKTQEGYVKRVKGKSKNYYELNGTKFNAIGGKVPSEVLEFLNMDDVNIQNQFDTFFLLQDSPGQVAKRFNEYVGLSLIDKVAKEAEITVRQANREVLKHKDDVNELKKEIKTYKYVDKAGTLIGKAKILEKQIKKITDGISQVKVLVQEHTALYEKLNELPDIEEIKTLLDRANTHLGNINENSSRSSNVAILVENFKRFYAESKTYKSLPQVKGLLQEADELAKSLKIDIESIFEVEKHLDSFNLLSSNSEANLKKLTEQKKILDELTKNLEVCPLCKQKWGNKNVLN